jgi:hypothetical protein
MIKLCKFEALGHRLDGMSGEEGSAVGRIVPVSGIWTVGVGQCAIFVAKILFGRYPGYAWL